MQTQIRFLREVAHIVAAMVTRRETDVSLESMVDWVQTEIVSGQYRVACARIRLK